MSNLDKIALGVYKPLTATIQPNLVVKDAFSLTVGEDERFITSNVAIERLDIASFVTGGLAARAKAPEGTETRASTHVVLPVSDGVRTEKAEATVTLYGPGDVVGLLPGMIIRRHPAPDIRDAEVSDLAHIEFARPELPWAFSASTAEAGKTMKPWLTLIVVPEEASKLEIVAGMPPILKVLNTELPDLTEADRWGHAQTPVIKSPGPKVDLPTRLSGEYAPVNLSRLVSPRVLRPDTAYIAALVPTTEIGRKQGLGLSGGGLGDAWPEEGSEISTLPVYDHWKFRTGSAGDFATMALRLKGVPAPWEVGRRFIDTSAPGNPMSESLAPGDAGGKQALQCALFSPADPPDAASSAMENASWPERMTEDLKEQLNRPAMLDGSSLENLPIVGPRIYAKAQRAVSTVQGAATDSDWFPQLNLSPANRIIAGLGTRVVQRDQEQLMQAAWAQIGEVTKANRAIALAGFGAEVAVRLHHRLSDLQQGHLVQMATPVAARIMMPEGRTLAANIATSSTPAMALSGAFRRALRPHGPVMGRLRNAKSLAGSVVGSGNTLRDFTRVYSNPDGVSALSSSSIAALNTSQVSSSLGIPQAQVFSTVTSASTAMEGGLFSLLQDQSRWGQAPGQFDLAGKIARNWLDSIMVEAPNAMIEGIRKKRVGPLAAALAVSSSPATRSIRTDLRSIAVNFNDVKITSSPTQPVVVETSFKPEVIVPPLGGTVVGRIPTIKSRDIQTSPSSPLTGLRKVNPDILSPIVTPDLKVPVPTPRPVPADPVGDALKVHAQRTTVQLTPILDSARTTTISSMRAALPSLLDPGSISKLPKAPTRPSANTAALLTVLDPRLTVENALRGRLSEAIRHGWLSGSIKPIMAAPKFHRPMFRALEDYDKNWLLPGMDHLPGTDFITVLAMNKSFMEAFLIGLSDEFGRELLWRGYPTDQRGTYFSRFWSDQSDDLSTQIHRFAAKDLGAHISIGSGGPEAGSERAVIVVKSDLVHRYPDTVITIARKQGDGASTHFKPAGQLFAEYMEPDITLVGVDVSISDLKSGDWWVVISEHPEATRFTSVKGSVHGPFIRASGTATSSVWALNNVHQPTQVAFAATDVIT